MKLIIIYEKLIEHCFKATGKFSDKVSRYINLNDL